MLGWFSVGIGVVALVIPRTVARVTGVGDGETARLVLRLVGLRELVSGAGILNRRRPTGWLWGRVAGDAIDLGLLVLGSRRGRRGRTLTAAAAVAGVTALDVATAADLSRDRDGGARVLPAEHAVRARSSVTVDQPREALARVGRRRRPVETGRRRGRRAGDDTRGRGANVERRAKEVARIRAQLVRAARGRNG